MIVFLTLIYVALLFGAAKLGLIRLNAFWKVSPVLWMVLLFFILFVPLQWGAPAGAANNYRAVMEVVPNVSGEVQTVEAQPLQPLTKGDPIFTIDPVQYEARARQLEAQLVLSRANLDRAEDLMARGVGRQVDVDIYQAEMDSLEAQLQSARWDLENTVVRAPADGYVVALTLRPGQRVANLPMRSWVAFVERQSELAVGIPQSRLRHVKPGQEVEVVLRMFPGQIIKGRVDRIVNVNPAAQLTPSGVIPAVPTAADPALPFGVVIALDDAAFDLAAIPGGAVGTAAVYTDSAAATHVIRRVMMRMEAWLNYIKP
ncbi:MAG: efflux RND transporter periplasmic adaptor subunit [Gammaproteobacteria bacterium]|nr:efflux RND transporter periplasmic adaptor subunit [Gammaproteobacteria bacterium]